MRSACGPLAPGVFLPDQVKANGCTDDVLPAHQLDVISLTREQQVLEIEHAEFVVHRKGGRRCHKSSTRCFLEPCSLASLRPSPETRIVGALSIRRTPGQPSVLTGEDPVRGELTAGQPARAGSRRTPPFHARGSAAHPGSAGSHAPPPRRPASRTPVRSRRHASSGRPPLSPGP